MIASMAKLAVDVVLLPPDEIMDFVIKINRELEDRRDGILLNKKDYLPHLTLAMGAVEESDIPFIEGRLKQALGKFSPIKITVSDIKTSDRPDGTKISSLEVEKSSELQALHEAVMKVMSNFFTYEGSPEMFYTPPLVEELPLFWLKNYHKTSVYEQYKPHITIGLGVPEKIALPITFIASKIALCHLGNYCTCRKIFFSFDMR